MKLNVGCGKDYREGYVNIDFAGCASDGTEIKVDVSHDIRDSFPNSISSVDEVLLYETLEHFNRHDALIVLKNIHSVMNVGAKIYVSVPPAMFQLKVLLTQMTKKVIIDDFLYAHEKFSPIKFLDDAVGATHRTKIDSADLGQGDSHKMFWTEQWLNVVMHYVGFKKIHSDSSVKYIGVKI